MKMGEGHVRVKGEGHREVIKKKTSDAQQVFFSISAPLIINNYVLIGCTVYNFFSF